MYELAQQVLNEVGPGKMSDVAYDTAWVARLDGVEQELSNRALAWLSENQLPDGSWGAAKPFYYHDRVISTLAAMIALTRSGRRTHDKLQVERGLLALEKIIEGANVGLPADSNGATVGFEMIVPTLIAEAEQLGIIQQQGETLLGQLGHLRKKKLSLLKGKMINRSITAAFSAEMAGMDGQQLLDIENLQESNGSVGHSPSATAYYASYVNEGDTKALNYLRNMTDHRGGVPDLFPFDVFETGWVLWNFSLVDNWDDQTKIMFRSMIDFLKKGWRSGKGIGLSNGYSIPDGDDTSFVYELLAVAGSRPGEIQEPGLDADRSRSERLLDSRDSYSCQRVCAHPLCLVPWILANATERPGLHLVRQADHHGRNPGRRSNDFRPLHLVLGPHGRRDELQLPDGRFRQCQPDVPDAGSVPGIGLESRRLLWRRLLPGALVRFPVRPEERKERNNPGQIDLG